MLAGTGAGHVHEAAFFFKIFGPRQGVTRGKAVFHKIDDAHGVPFQPLGRMHGGKGDLALGVVFVLFGRFQRQIGQKKIQMHVARSHLNDFFKTLLTAGPVLGVQGFQPGAVVLQYGRQRGRGGHGARTQVVDEAHVFQKAHVFAKGFFRGGRVAAARHGIELFHGFGADAAVLGGHAGKGGQVQRIEQQAGVGHDVLDVGGLGIAQAAVLAKADASLVERHFKIVGVEARAEEHGDFVGQMLAQQFLHAAHHKLGLAGVAQGRDQAHRLAAFLSREQVFMKGLRRMGQQAVGHIQHGLG